MKRTYAVIGAILAFAGLGGAAYGAEISPVLAQQAVDVWIKRGQPIQGVTDVAKTIVDPETGARINVVTLKGGGYVITAGDDLRGPVMAFSETGTFDPDPDNPLWILVKGDARLSPAETNAVRRLSPAAGNVSRTEEQQLWDELLGRGNGARRSSGSLPSGAVVRCAPMIKTVWGQGTHNNYSEEDGGLPCYNYYTPVDVEYVESQSQKSSPQGGIAEDGLSANMAPESYRSPCGCVATAGAQLMFYHKYPSSAKAGTFACTAFSVATNMHVSGSTYRWSDMEVNPRKRHSEQCRKAIGRLTADVGISCGASYGRSKTSASIWSTYQPCLMQSLVDTFRYAQAKRFGGYSAADFRANALPNLDARKPIIVELYDHAIVADGYAWDSEAQGTLYVHVNMGWYGSSDGWYVPPKIATYTSIQGFLGNIFTTETGYIASGRVLGSDGSPVRGAVVRLKDGNNVLATSKATDDQGVYSMIYKYAFSSTYKLEATSGDQVRSVSVETSYSSQNILQDITVPVEVAVSDPVVTCSSGSYPVLVTMTCATPNALIRYTTNRSVPTEENSKLYDKPFYIYGSTTFKVRAFKSGFKASSVVLHAYDHGTKASADSFSSAPTLSADSGEIELSNVGATIESGEPSLLSGNSLWLSFAAPESGCYDFSASGTTSDGEQLEIACAAYKGASLSQLSRITAAYDGIKLNAERGTTYKIALDTYRTQGDITLSWKKCDVVEPEATSVDATAEAGSGSVTIQSTAAWEVVECPEWIRLSRTSGASGDTLTYSYARNVYSSIRNGIITLRAGDSDDVDITVCQMGEGWYLTKAAAETAARASGKRIVLVYGHGGCYNTTSVRKFMSTDVDIHAILDRGYIVWYCNCYGATRSEASPYISGIDSSAYLPYIAIIDVTDMSKYLVRTTGYQSASAIKTMLQNYAPVNPQPITTVTVTFDGNGGTASFTSRSYTIGSAYGTLPTATLSGYTFDGWYTAASGGTKVTTSTAASASVSKLYAHWTVAAPANDGFASASTLSGSSGSVTGSNVGATSESGEPLLATWPSAKTVWWKWTAPSSGKVRFDTIGSAFDTVMGVYTGSSLSSLTKIAEDDDGGGSGNTSKCEFDCTSGTRYYVAVAGYSGKTGAISLQWSLTAVSSSVTVTFDGNGGTASFTTRSYTIGSAYGTLPTATLSGYTFDGWYTAASGGTKVTASTAASASVTRLYARWIANSSGAFRYAVFNGEAKITGCDGASGAISVPSTIGGYAVTAIGEQAFYTNVCITSVTLPSGVRTIETKAFSKCTALQTVVLPSTLKSIGYGAFYQCPKLSSATLPEGLTSIGELAFCDCKALSRLTIPASVTSVGDFAFAGCTLSLSVAAANANYYSSGDALYSKDRQTLCWVNAAKTTFDIPSDVRSICSGAFCSCNRLTSVVVPSGVTTISLLTFQLCSSLTSVTLPATVTTLSPWAFQSCPASAVIHFLGAPPTCSQELYGPKNGTYSAYNSEWGAAIVEGVWKGLAMKYAAPTSMTVSFDGNSGTASFTSRSYIIGSAYGTLPTATRSGYSFAGWYTAASGGTLVTASTTVVSSVSRLYAHWTAVSKTYTVTYKPGAYGNGSQQTATKTQGVALTLKGAIFTRDYYAQTGWSTSDGGTRAYVLGGTYSTNASVTLYPYWTQTSVPVAFDGNGGTASVASTIYAIGSAYGTLPTATLSGYAFAGWYTAASGGTKVTTTTSVSASVTRLYAHWTKLTYSVRFHYNNGGTDTMQAQSVGCGDSRTLLWKDSQLGWANPSGKTFLGWSTSAASGLVKYANGATVKDLAAAGKTVDLYAVWYDAKTDYIVKFHRNASGSDATVAQQRMKRGVSSALAWKDSGLGWANPSGKAFVGWGASAGTTLAKYANGATVKDLVAAGKSLDLYAVWRPINSYVVTFHRNATGGDATTASQWISRGSATTLAWKDSGLGWANPSGYTFLGWAETASGAVKYANGQKVTDIAAAGVTKNLYAKWKANAYTVRYHYNYGTDARTADQAFAYGAEQSLKWLDSGLKWPHPQSAAFLGWATTADGTKKYDNGQKVKNLTAASGGVVHLYAKWNLVTVRFHKNVGGTDVTALQYFKPGVAQNLLWKDSGLKWATPSGKLFVGWGVAANATVAKYANGEKVTNPAAAGKTVHLYAVWSSIANDYMIRYYRNYTASDATCAYERRAISGSSALAWKDSQLGWANPSGKTFLGWSMTRTATAATYANGQQIPAIAAQGAAVNLFAIWGASKKSEEATSSSLQNDDVRSTTSPFTLSPFTLSPGYYRGTFADGSGTFDLLLDAFGGDGVATAYFAAQTANGCQAEECEAEIVGDTLVLTFEDGQVVIRLEDGRYVVR